MSRWKAAGIHLSISLFIGLIIGVLLLTVWYPPPFFHGAGADELVILLVGVDVTLGPLITLIIFKSGKKSLKFDLTVIAVLQSAALIYGLWVVLQSRPVFLVATIDRFVLVSANELEIEDLNNGSKPEFRNLSWVGPRLVAVELPTDPAQHNALLTSGLAGKDVEKFPKYYIDYDKAVTRLLAKAHPFETLRQSDAANSAILDNFLKKNALKDSDVLWLPLTARKQDMTMLISAATGKPIKALPINPW